LALCSTWPFLLFTFSEPECTFYPLYPFSNEFRKGQSMREVEYEIVGAAPIEEIVELYKAGGWWQESPETRAVIPPMIRGSLCFMVARSLDGRIVGMGRVISDGHSDAYIQDVVVLEAYRGQGVGRELVRRLTQFCTARKISWIGLIAEPGTQGLYEELGFGALIGYQPMLHGKR
jgi:ribosomal protein S18 acetylase RimI-like enzyme